MSNHIQIAAATNLEVYFCDPRSPWSEAPTKTPTACCASTSPRAPTCVHGVGYFDFVAANSTTDPANDSTGAPPPKPSTTYCHNRSIQPVLR